MPLGDPHSGSCVAHGAPSPAGCTRTCCNTGYARGQCASFPGGDAPDAVRFGIVQRDRGIATVEYVIERNHYPFDHGKLELRESESPLGGTAATSLLERQARAFLSSYLRRNS